MAQSCLQRARHFSPFCFILILLPFCLHICGPHGHIMAVPARSHACLSALKVERRIGAGATRVYLYQGVKIIGISLLTYYIILGNMASLGGKCVRENEHVVEGTVIWIVMIGLDQSRFIFWDEWAHCCPVDKIRILLAREKRSEGYVVDHCQCVSLYQLENTMGIEDGNHSDDNFWKKSTTYVE